MGNRLLPANGAQIGLEAGLDWTRAACLPLGHRASLLDPDGLRRLGKGETRAPAMSRQGTPLVGINPDPWLVPELRHFQSREQTGPPHPPDGVTPPLQHPTHATPIPHL